MLIDCGIQKLNDNFFVFISCIKIVDGVPQVLLAFRL